MAVSEKIVVNDIPSTVVHDLRGEFNDLLDAVDASTGYADLKSGILAACKKIITSRELPLPPQAPTPKP